MVTHDMDYADRYGLLCGLLMEEYRRIYYDHEITRHGIEIEIGSSSLIELALHWGGLGHDTEVLLELADTFVAIAESMIAEKMPPEDVQSV